MTKLTCQHCGKSFTGLRNDRKYCSAECKRAVARKQYYARTGIKTHEAKCAICGEVLTAHTSKRKLCGNPACHRERNRRQNEVHIAKITACTADNPGITGVTVWLIDRFMRENGLTFKQACQRLGRGTFVDAVEQELNRCGLIVLPDGLARAKRKMG